MNVSIYIKSTGQIIQHRSVQHNNELDVLSGDYGYVEGSHPLLLSKWNGSEVVSYTPPYPAGKHEAEVRRKRDLLLFDCDWTQATDSPLSDSKKAEWATYRQALRDLMDSYTDSEANDLDSVTFPTPPP